MPAQFVPSRFSDLVNDLPTVVNGLTDAAAPSALDLFYLARSPYTAGSDRKLTWAELMAQGLGLFSVVNYGADPTGAADSTRAFTNALVASAATGVAYVPTGTYTVGTPTTLNGAINNSVLSLVVASAASFPNATSFTILIDSEQMTVTAGMGTATWTVTRAANGTAAASHSNGAAVQIVSIAWPSNTYIRGAGQALSKVTVAANGNVGRMFDATGSSNVQMSDLTLDGNQANQGASVSNYGELLNLSSATNVTIRDVTLNNPTGDGIYASTSTTSATINNVTVANGRRRGMRFVGGTALAISEATVTNCAYGGVYFITCSNFKMRGGTMDTCTSTSDGGHGVFANTSCDRFSIIGVNTLNTAGDSINATASTNGEIVGCTVLNPGDLGIELYNGCKNIAISGNTVYCAQTTATGVNALNSATVNVGSTTLFPASGSFSLGGVITTYTGKTSTTLTGCGNHAATTGGELIIAATCSNAIGVNLACTDCTVTGNVANGATGRSSTIGAGLIVDGVSLRITVTGNTSTNNVVGLQIGTSSDATDYVYADNNNLTGSTTAFVMSCTGTNNIVRKVGKPAVLQAQPANPTGTTDTTGKMMGLAQSITPVNVPTRLLVTVGGDIYNATAIADGAKVKIKYGTGSAPANGDAPAGTQLGAQVSYVASTTAGKVPFTVTGLLTGLTAGTAYWIDVQLAAVTGGTANIENLSVSVMEL